MPCYHPMLAVPKSINHETGKVQYCFKGQLDEVAQLSEVVELEGKIYPVKALPCGNCIGCRLDYSKEWSIRCMLELEDHKSEECYFITLTYDDLSVPMAPYPLAGYDFWRDQDFNFYPRINKYFSCKGGYECSHEDLTGLCSDLGWSMTLRPRDVQLFLKRLRKWQKKDYGREIRFYLCGEYGSRSARPHYHLIVFGLQLEPPKKETWKTVRNGNTLWESKELESVWKLGNVIVGSVSYESIGYVARYMLKKQKGHYGDFYRSFNLVPEFTRMSLKPGIGQRYFELNKDEIYKYDEIFITTQKRGLKVKPPRYFDLQAQEEFPDLFDQLKVNRSDCAFHAMQAKEERSGLKISEVLANEEEARKFKTKILQERSSAS